MDRINLESNDEMPQNLSIFLSTYPAKTQSVIP